VRRLRWEPPRRAGAIPKHPYRDTALVYGVLAVMVVILSLATGGSLARAVIIAVLVYVVATVWSWRTWRNRLRERDAQQDEQTPV
jgi:membrane protein implicated in regulation of membrane protease activity